MSKITRHAKWLNNPNFTDCRFVWEEGDPLSYASENLNGADFSQCQDRKIEFEDCNLSKICFSGPQISNWTIRGCKLYETEFNQSRILVCTFNDNFMHACRFTDCCFSGSVLTDNYMLKTTFFNTTFMCSEFGRNDQHGTEFRACNIVGGARDFGIATMFLDPWNVTITETMTRIGCIYRPNEYWLGATDSQISNLDREALDWWGKYGNVVKEVIESTMSGRVL